MNEYVIEMLNITKEFPGIRANDDITLRLRRGEIHALLGENGAGKSTLMSVLFGLYQPEKGVIKKDGEVVRIKDPNDANSLNIGMVHQHFKLVEVFTVLENIILGVEPNKFGFLEKKEARKKVVSLSERYGLKIDPDALIEDISVGMQQRVEILKMLYRDNDILIFDEPTAVLTPQEIEELMHIMRSFAAEGKSILFITHKLNEIMAVADRCTVLRKGKCIGTVDVKDTDKARLSRMMVGREVLFHIKKGPFQPGAVVLELKDVCAADDRGLPALRDLSLTVRAGEILGIAGVAGNGQRELSEVITGLRPAASGGVSINCVDSTNKTPLQIIRSGVSHIPSDRMAVGAVGDMSVANNLAMKDYRASPISKGILLLPRRIQEFARKMIGLFNIATPSPETRVKFLSGGNIQKTLLAREIEACGSLLVAVYPSRGLDIGATESVRMELVAQRDAGRAVLLVSEDIDELLSVADTIAVMYDGRAVGVMPAAGADPEEIGLLMAGMKSTKESAS